MKEPIIYCSSYCNHGHNLKTGHPVKHECRIIPPAALHAEREGNYDLAQQILSTTPATIVRGK